MLCSEFLEWILQDWMDVDMAKVDAAVEMPITLDQEDE